MHIKLKIDYSMKNNYFWFLMDRFIIYLWLMIIFLKTIYCISCWLYNIIFIKKQFEGKDDKRKEIMELI